MPNIEFTNLTDTSASELLGALARGDFVAAMRMFAENLKERDEFRLKEDLELAAKQPPGAAQWACVRRPDAAISFLAAAAGPDLLFECCDAVLKATITKDRAVEDGIYAFNRDVFSMVTDLVQAGKITDEDEARAQKCRVEFEALEAKLTKVDADTEMERGGQLAIAVRWGVVCRLWGHMKIHLRDCEAESCPIGTAMEMAFTERAIDMLSGCGLLERHYLLTEKGPEITGGDVLALERSLAERIRSVAPFELLQVYANGTLKKGSLFSCGKGKN